MSEKKQEVPQNTLDLLQSLGELPEVEAGRFDVDQILAEFGSSKQPERPPSQPPGQAPKEVPPGRAEERAEPLDATSAVPVRADAKTRRVPVQTKKAEKPKPPEKPPEKPKEMDELESIVSSTVAAVLEEQNEVRQEATRQMKQRQKKDYQAKTKHEEKPEEPDFTEEEPSLTGAALRLKLRQRRLRRLARSAAVFAGLYWALALAERYIPVPPSDTVRLLVSLALQGCVIVCAWPVLVRAVEELGQGAVGWALLSTLNALAAFLDTATASLLPGRCAGESLGGVAMVLSAAALYGAWLECSGLRETLRVAALGRPAYVVDIGASGAVKGSGGTAGFYNRAVSENDAAYWQRLLLPVILAAAAVFALISSVGQKQDFLWCFSVILTAGTPLSLPLVYGLPFSRLANRLGKSGGAVAGNYGAGQLAKSREMVLTDGDLFPPGCVRLRGKSILDDDPQKAASYAGSLAEELNACYTPLMRTFMQEERGRRQELVHFHIHSDGGASASIRGETAVLGSALTLRKQGVHLPRSLEQPEGLYLAVDGQLSAIFALEYTSREGVEWALHAMRRSGITPLLALRDGALNPRFLKQKFGSDGGAILLDAAERGNLTRPRRTEDPKPNGLLYREGLTPFFELVAGSKRLVQLVRIGNLLSLGGAAAGTLLGYYLAFVRAVTLVTPGMLLVFLLLWLAPVLVLDWNADKI